MMRVPFAISSAIAAARSRYFRLLTQKKTRMPWVRFLPAISTGSTSGYLVDSQAGCAVVGVARHT